MKKFLKVNVNGEPSVGGIVDMLPVGTAAQGKGVWISEDMETQYFEIPGEEPQVTESNPQAHLFTLKGSIAALEDKLEEEGWEEAEDPVKYSGSRSFWTKTVKEEEWKGGSSSRTLTLYDKREDPEFPGDIHAVERFMY